MVLTSWLNDCFRQAYLSARGIVMEATVAYPIPITPAFWNHKTLRCIVCIWKCSTIISTKRPTRSRMEWILIRHSIWPTRIQWKWLLKIGIACHPSIHLESQSSMCPGKIMCMSRERSSRHCNCWDCCHLLWLPTLFAFLSWSIIVVTATYRSICHTNPTNGATSQDKAAKYTHTNQPIPNQKEHTQNTRTHTSHTLNPIDCKLQTSTWQSKYKFKALQKHSEWQVAALPIKICRFIKLYQSNAYSNK